MSKKPGAVQCGYTTHTGDINGDGIDDFCVGALIADGPDNSRARAGEIYVFYGPLSFPADLQIGDSEHDLTIYGAHSAGGLLSDLDGSDYGACQNHRDPDRSDTSFEEDETPASADGFFFLVRGKNLGCPASGSYGESSSGTDRPNSNPAAYP